MNHYVFWSPAADEKLQAIILAAEERPRLTRIVRGIEFWLARGPREFGESRFEPVRLGVIERVAVLFEVLDDPPTVIVLDIWRF